MWMCEYERSDGRVLIGVSHGYVNWQNVSKEPSLHEFITDVVSNGLAHSGSASGRSQLHLITLS